MNRWRQETIGKRRAELAEEVLADFYEAKDIIQAARSPFSRGDEGSSRKKSGTENEHDTGRLNAYYAVAERLHAKSEFFARLSARRYRFVAHFGLEAAKPYDQLREAYNEVIVAVQMLLMTERRQRLDDSAVEEERDWQKTIWHMSVEGDEIERRVGLAVSSIEATCRPIIQENVRKFRKRGA